MIKAVYVMSRDCLVRNYDQICKGHLASTFDCESVALVSIYDTNKKPVIDLGNAAELEDALHRSISLSFDDIITSEQGRKCPSRIMVKHIAEFIDEVDCCPETYLFIAQCDSGVSRSGAVGEYVCMRSRYLGVDLVQLNPKVCPNILMQQYFREILDEFVRERNRFE